VKRRVHIVAHDAGGAEVLAAWCRENRGAFEFCCTCRGPALPIFQRDLSSLPFVALEAISLLAPDGLLLTGTSLEADLERTALEIARRSGVRSVAFLDHWDLYRERFGDASTWRGGLPDEIWVGDRYAYEKALHDGFPEGRLKLVENPYFKEILALGATAARPSGYGRILYVCEPVSRKLAAAFGASASEYPDETEIMGLFLDAVHAHREEIEAVTLRLHPSEDPSKYETLLGRCLGGPPVAYSKNSSLADDILGHSVVVGIESNALVIGLLLGRAVYSCIPRRPWDISLPHREIRRIPNFDRIFSSEEHQ